MEQARHCLLQVGPMETHVPGGLHRQQARIQHSREQGKTFDGIVSTAETSNAAKKAVNFGTANHVTETTKKMVDSLGGYLDNLAGAVTN